MGSTIEITEFRRGRNFIRKDDVVHVRKGWSGSKNGFDTKVKLIRANPDGTPQNVDVIDPRSGAIRTIRPEFIERRAQQKNGEAVHVRLPAAVPPGPHKAGRR